ncbi:hypothetical protein KXS07_11405 [Inquilinus limosus]|uniref:hypothetical protein n=1 Tax=Inquilinus limosus TaxID=171674 RepID=UPI003F13DFD1
MIGAFVWRLARPVIAAVLASSLIVAAISGAYAAPSLGLQLRLGAGPSEPVELVRFISPDSWDPTIPGVGTNRYAYADNDPINKSDPSGHVVPLALGLAALGALLGSSTEANAPGPDDPIQTTTNPEMLGNMALGAAAGMSLGGAAMAPEGRLALESARALAALNQTAEGTPSLREAARVRQAEMLRSNVGYNVSPTSFDKYDRLGRSMTYVTDQKAIVDVIGPLSERMTITSSQAAKLEQALGLTENSLQKGFKVRRIEDIINRDPVSPTVGNDLFKGPGEHLPGGGPEIGLGQTAPTSGPGVDTISTVDVE